MKGLLILYSSNDFLNQIKIIKPAVTWNSYDLVMEIEATMNIGRSDESLFCEYLE